MFRDRLKTTDTDSPLLAAGYPLPLTWSDPVFVFVRARMQSTPRFMPCGMAIFYGVSNTPIVPYRLVHDIPSTPSFVPPCSLTVIK